MGGAGQDSPGPGTGQCPARLEMDPRSTGLEGPPWPRAVGRILTARAHQERSGDPGTWNTAMAGKDTGWVGAGGGTGGTWHLPSSKP